MQIIPVLDLKDGVVVHAAGGDRSRYAPVHHTSSLCDNSAAEAVLARLLELYPFSTVYIADLNAISGNGDHNQLIAQLQHAYPQLQFWVDSGISAEAVTHITLPSNCQSVIGSESQEAPTSLHKTNVILSLDFKHHRALGHPGWLDTPAYWPNTIIVMTLDLVGSNQGPDFEKLSTLCQQHPTKRFIAAGGVRDIDDLSRLKTLGVAGVLLASALHNGSIGKPDLQKF